MVETSPTVTNSVTFRILLPSSCACNSASLRSRCVSLLSLRYLADFDLFPLPCKRSRVSLIWFLTSSSVGSTFWMIGFLPLLKLLLLLLLALLPFMNSFLGPVPG